MGASARPITTPRPGTGEDRKSKGSGMASPFELDARLPGRHAAFISVYKTAIRPSCTSATSYVLWLTALAQTISAPRAQLREGKIPCSAMT